MKNLILQLKEFEIKSIKIFLNKFFLYQIFSLKTRENSLRTLQILFSQKYLPDQVANRYIKNLFNIKINNHLFIFRSENLIEQLITCLKKGYESEGKLAAIVTSLVCIQLGEPNDELYIKFRDAIMPILRDETKSSSLRTAVCLFYFQNKYFMNISIVCSSNWFYFFYY
jgi:hypothetical protein